MDNIYFPCSKNNGREGELGREREREREIKREREREKKNTMHEVLQFTI